MKRLSLILLLVFVSGCIPAVPVMNVHVQGSGEYINSYYGYSLVPPAGWQLVEAGQGGAVSIMESSYESGAIITIEVDQTVDGLDEVFDDIRDRRESSNILLDTVVIGESNVVVDGVNGKALEYTYYMGGERKAKEIIVVVDGKAYDIMYQAYADDYDDFYDDFEDSLVTFSF